MSGRVMRHLDTGSPLHRLWAGTKVLWVPIVGTTIALQLSWAAVGIGWVVLLSLFALSRLPRGVLPKPPKIMWIGLGISFGLTALSTEEPAFGPISIGAAVDLARFIAFAWMMTAMALLIGWTTRLDDIAAAINRLLRPFRRLRLPVDEIGTVLTIAVRTVPLLIDEVRVIVAARRLRPQEEPPQPYLDQLVDIAVALVVSTFRRAGDMARTLASRGGVRTPPPDRHNPGRIDLVAALVGAAIMGLVIFIG